MNRCSAWLIVCCLVFVTAGSVSSEARAPNRAQGPARPPAPTWFSDQAIQRHKTQRSVILGSQMQKNAVLSLPKETQKSKDVPEKQKQTVPGDVQFSYDNEKRNWSSHPSHLSPLSDEGLGLHEEHRLRAFTHLDDDQNLDISAGPELIFKDQKHNTTVRSSKQPDTELGVGMRFTYDF